MTEKTHATPDISVVYDRGIPPVGAGWRLASHLRFIPLKKLNNMLLKGDSSCKLVFFPLKPEKNQLYKELRTIFPRAEYISYSETLGGEIERISHDLGFSVHLCLPVGASLLEYIYNHQAVMWEEIERKLGAEAIGENKVLRLFNEVLNILTLDSDPSSTYKDFATWTSGLLECEDFHVYVFDEENGRLSLAHAASPLFGDDGVLHLSSSVLDLDEILFNGEPVVLNGVDEEVASPSGSGNLAVRSLLVFPFGSRKRSQGLFLALNKSGPGGFTELDRQCLSVIASPFAHIHSSMIYHQNVRRLTITDELTGLYNFRYLSQFLTIEVKRSTRYGKKISVLFIDIDNFKTVNDTHGHLVGSATLREMGQFFKPMVRETDVLVRYGGDEFVVILPECPLEGAKNLAERLRSAVEAHSFSGGKGLGFHLTISIGVSQFPLHSATPDGLLQKADAAMYQAKEESKNKVKVAV